MKDSDRQEIFDTFMPYAAVFWGNLLFYAYFSLRTFYTSSYFNLDSYQVEALFVRLPGYFFIPTMLVWGALGIYASYKAFGLEMFTTHFNGYFRNHIKAKHFISVKYTVYLILILEIPNMVYRIVTG